MNRRGFIRGMAATAGLFTILPGTGRIWRAPATVGQLVKFRQFKWDMKTQGGGFMGIPQWFSSEFLKGSLLTGCFANCGVCPTGEFQWRRVQVHKRKLPSSVIVTPILDPVDPTRVGGREMMLHVNYEGIDMDRFRITTGDGLLGIVEAWRKVVEAA